MDPKEIGDWLSGEIVVVAHVSFWVAVGVAAFFIWRAMEWRYRAIFDGFEQRLKLRDEKLQYLGQDHEDGHLDLARSSGISPTAVEKMPREDGAAQQERVFIPESIGPDDLRDLYKDKTNYQAEKLAEGYLGKWMRVEGEVKNVTSAYGGGGHISLSKEGAAPVSRESLRSIYLHVEKDDPRLGMLRPGDKVEAIGRITGFDLFDISLDPAELV